jgi:RNA polymerase primary sigma factor
MKDLLVWKRQALDEDIPLRQYINEIKNIKPLSAEQEAELARKIREGDSEALQELVVSNLRFVVYIAKQYQNCGLSLLDLICEGNIGLIRAAELFDETKGFKFITYAVYWIKDSICRALNEYSRILKIPRNKINNHFKPGNELTSLDEIFESNLSCEFDFPALSQKMGIADSPIIISLDDTREESKQLIRKSLPQNFYDDSEILLEMQIESLNREIERVLSTMTNRESMVIKLYYGLNGYSAHTLKEIAEKMDISVSGISVIKERGLRRLKHSRRSKILKPLLGLD